jgi:hypothetical protein
MKEPMNPKIQVEQTRKHLLDVLRLVAREVVRRITMEGDASAPGREVSPHDSGKKNRRLNGA